MNTSLFYVFTRRSFFIGAMLLTAFFIPAVAFAAVPDVPTLVTPINAAENQQLAPTLTWNASLGATSYQLQVSTINDFSTTVYNDLTLTGTSVMITGLYYETTYYWHVSAKNVDGTSAYSGTQTFLTGPSPVNLLSTAPFVVLAASLISNIPTSAILGNVGLSPAGGNAITGFGLSEITGTIYTVDPTYPGPSVAVVDPALLSTAKGDLTTAYNNTTTRIPVPTGTFLNPGVGNMSGLTLPGGLYKFTGTASLQGSSVTLTGSVTDIWVFMINSTLILEDGMQVILSGNAKASNIFWQVGTSATLKPNSVTKGTIMADQSITLQTNARLDGRALARIGAVTLDANAITNQEVLAVSLNLRTAAGFGVLSGDGITGTGSIKGNAGTFTSTISAPITTSGSKYEGTSEVTTARTDLNTAYLDAAGRIVNVTNLSAGSYELGGGSLPPGTYKIGSDATITGTLNLNGAGVYIFQVGGTLTTGAASNVNLSNGAEWHTIYWQVGGNTATLGANSIFNGNLLAKKSISVGNLALMNGRLLAGADDPTGIVTLDNISVLPVELTSFTAMLNNGSVELNWNTATEINNYGFEVQKSRVENLEWIKIGFVNGSGNSNISKDYSFTESNLQSGKYYYRLKQIDKDGAFAYSNTIEVDVTSGITKFALQQNYPNPFNPATIIKYSLAQEGNVELTIYNSIGKKVATLIDGYKTAGTHSVQFNGSDLASGMYLYRIVSGNFSAQKKFILMK